MGRPRILPVVDGVWCVQRIGYLSCSYVVARPEGVVLVDAGIDVHGRDMERGIEAAGARVEDVRAILLTHWHNDHSSGAAAIRERSGCAIHHHAAGTPRLTRTKRARGLRGFVGRRLPGDGWLAPFRSLLELAPLRAVDDTATVREGDVLYGAFEVWETPGHSSDHVSYWLRDAGVLFTGDALAVAGGTLSFMSRWLTEDVERARGSMLRCLEHDAVAYCPGHRGPLRDPGRATRDALARHVRALERWPVYGCRVRLPRVPSSDVGS